MQFRHPTAWLLFALLPTAIAQDFHRHEPDLLPAQVTAMGLDPVAGRLVAVANSPVTLGSQTMYHRIGHRWHRVTDQMPTMVRLIADTARQRLVGLGLDFQTMTTWEWTGGTWQHRHSLHLNQPPNKLLACYHDGLGKVVLMDPFLRMLAWDGSQWQPVGTGPQPPWGGELVYDRFRDRCVLFTGDALHEWNGSTWQQPGLLVLPPARNEFGMVYDPVRRRTVLFGGNAFQDLQDTWEYDGSQWLQRTPAQSPPVRMRHCMQWDPMRQRVVLVGGHGHDQVGRFGAFLNDEWEWDGQDWLCLQCDRRPPSCDPAMVTDPVIGSVLLVRSSAEWSPSATRMWRWRGAEWLPHAPGATTPASVTALCADPGRGALWCYDGGLTSLTWRFDGSTWQQLTPASSPPPRGSARMAFDRARNVAVLFGGDNYAQSFDDTWEWDGSTWTERLPVTRPGARFRHCMGFDPIGNRVLMTGGATGTLQTTWAYDGSDWRDLGQTVPAGFRLGMAEHAGRGRLVLWNGTGALWEWTGGTWAPWPAPLPAALAAARYPNAAPFRDTLVVWDRTATWVLGASGAAASAHGQGCGPGEPRLAASGTPTPGTTDFGLLLDRAEPSGLAFLLVSLAPDAVPFGACHLLLQSPVTVGLVPLSVTGLAAFEFPLPDAAWLFGTDVFWQAITFGNGGIAFSAGLRTRAGY